MKIAIIGNGMVGSTCAYYLGKEKNIKIDLYDDKQHSGTLAAVGIICPWVSQRRNQLWYDLVEKGANFYTKLSHDLNTQAFIRKTGAIVIHDTLHHKLLQLAQSRLEDNPIMKSVQEVSDTPSGFNYEKGIFIEGAFSVDGREFLKTINRATENTNFINKTITLKELLDQDYDKIVIASGGRIDPWLQELKIKLDHHAQKGMLLEFNYKENKHPIVMPKGEIDFLFKDQALVIGASHENEYSHLDYDEKIAENLISQATSFLDFDTSSFSHRIGLRSQNSKNQPFFGALKNYPNILCVGGLGSSGLTSGPYIGYLLSQNIIHNTPLDEQYHVEQFIK